jgi:hypothetical protein
MVGIASLILVRRDCATLARRGRDCARSVALYGAGLAVGMGPFFALYAAAGRFGKLVHGYRWAIVVSKGAAPFSWAGGRFSLSTAPQRRVPSENLARSVALWLLGRVNTTPIRIELTEGERRELESRARGQRAAYRDVVRAKIILLIADGHTLSSVARQVSKQRKIVRKWAERFSKRRLEGLVDKPGRGRVPDFSPGGVHASGQTGLRAA